MFRSLTKVYHEFTLLKSKKQIDNTSINVVRYDKWTNHFCKKFAKNEPNTNLQMKKLLPKLEDSSFIIDVGAHVGDTGLYLAYHLQKYYPDKNIDVIMIEPDKTKFDFIQKMIKLNKLTNCFVINCGVSDNPSTGSLDINKEFPGATLVNEDDSGEIFIDSIDNLCKDCKVSMMHIDVEGMEYKCLVGAQNVLKNVKYIVIELNDICERYKERQFLRDNHYTQIENKEMLEEYNNELYVKKEMSEDLT
tara:strand:+ start:506 stop:1249 length:744 start_codon:yes stop_codon:yes gene_type:complete